MYTNYPSIIKYSEWRRASLLGLLLALCLPLTAANPVNDDCVDESTYASVPLGPYLTMPCPNDFDCDLVLDVNDVDDDNDGILDVDECEFTVLAQIGFEGVDPVDPSLTAVDPRNNFKSNFNFAGTAVVATTASPDFVADMTNSPWFKSGEGASYAALQGGAASAPYAGGDGLLFSISAGDLAGSSVQSGDEITVSFLYAPGYNYDAGGRAADAGTELLVFYGNGTVNAINDLNLSTATPTDQISSGEWLDDGVFPPAPALRWPVMPANTFQVYNGTFTYTGNDVYFFVICVNTDGDPTGDYVFFDDLKLVVSEGCGNTDGTLGVNSQDIDSDGDGCNDVIEAGHEDPDGDGVLGTSPVTVGAFGRVLNEGGYTGPAAAVTDAQDFLACCEIDITSALPVGEGCLGAGDGTMTVVATGAATINYTLTLNGTEVATNQTGSFTGLAAGTYLVTVEDAASAGCTDEETAVVVAAGMDTEAPATPTLADLTDECSVTVVAPTTTDNCAGTITGTTSTDISAPLTVDATITWTFTDGTNEIMVDQAVVITDVTNAVAVCNTAVELSLDTETVTLTAADLDNGSADNCGGAINLAITAGQTVFGCDDIGEAAVTVTLSADDGTTTATTCTSQVTVVAGSFSCNSDPTVTCAPFTVDADASCMGAAAGADFVATSNDPDGDALTFTAVPGGPYALGTTNVTVTADDGNGGTATCMTTITVEDNNAPTINCPAPVTIMTSELGGGGGSLIGGDVFYPLTSDLMDVNGVGTDAYAYVFPSGSTPPALDPTNGMCFNTTEYAALVVIPPSSFDNTDFRLSFDARVDESSARNTTEFGAIFEISQTSRWAHVGVRQDGTVGIETGNHSNRFPSSYILNFGDWHSYEVRYQGGVFTLLVDGNVVLTQSMTSNTGNNSMGSRSNGNGLRLIGCIRNVSIDGQPTQSGGGDACTAEVDLMATATDNCGTVNITDDAPAMYGLGTTTVTFTATDGASLTASCTSTVTLVDDVAPDADCVSAFTVDLEATETVTITPDMLDNGSSDNCTVNLAIDGGNPTYTCVDLGQTFTLQLNVTDGSSNSANCSVMVTVEDANNYCYTCDLGFTVEDEMNGNPPGIITSRIVCGNDGIITVNAFCNGCDDGNADLRYSISPDPNSVGQQTSNVFTGLTDGDYTVTILDVDNPACNTSTSATIGECVGEIPGNNIDDDCDSATDELSSIAWILLESGEGCTANTDDCASVFCYGLEYTPTVSGTLTSYTTGFLSTCIAGSTPLISNLSCVMVDNSFDAEDCGTTGNIFFNSSGNNGTVELTKDMPIILHQICLSIPAETTLMLEKDAVTDITLSIDVLPILSTDDIIVATDRPDYTEATAAGNMPPVVTANAGAVDACYATVAEAEAAALLATTATDDFTPVGNLVTTVVTVGTCSATVTVTVADACGLTTDVTYATRIDNDAPAITGTLETLTDEGCSANDARTAVDNVGDLEALGVTGFDIMDNCTDDATLVVTYVDASTGTCPVVVTRTYTITDECGNSSTVDQTINVNDTTAPAVTGALTAVVLEGCDISVAPAVVTTVADLEGLLGDLLIEDACTDDPTLVVTYEDVVGTACPIVITRTYTITDACTNSSEVVHTITIEDTVLPEIAATGTINACYTTVELAEAAALAAVSVTDNCDATITGVVSTVGDCTATITINAQDACGNDAVPVTFTAQITGGAVPTEVGGPVAISADIQTTLDNVVPDAPVFEDVCGNTLSPAGPTIGGTYVEGTCEGTITYTYTYTDCAGTSVDWVFTYNVNCQGLRLKVFIEGGLNVGTSILSTEYNENHLLPGQNNALSPLFAVQITTPTPAGHPYGGTPWSFTDTDGSIYGDFAGQTAYPDHVADWVLVTVRMGSRAPAANVWKGAGWLHENGEVTFPEGSLANDVTLDAGETYYIVVEHRNHLPVLATATVQGSGASLYLEHDFTVADSYAPIFRFGQIEVGAGVFAMYAGNADQMSSRASINSSDHTGWRLDQTQVGYLLGDFNQNMTANSEDETIWKLNQNRTTGIVFE